MFSQRAKQAIVSNPDLKNFLKGKTITYVDSSLNPEVVRKYNVTSFPSYIFLDHHGRETWRDSGFNEDNELLKLLMERYDKPDGLDDVLIRLRAEKNGMDLYIASIQLLGRGQYSKAVDLIREYYPKNSSNLEKQSINRLLYRAATGLEDYSIPLDAIKNSLQSDESWDVSGQPAMDELHRVTSITQKWNYFLNSVQSLASSQNQIPGFYFSLSNAYLHSKTSPVMGYHYAKKAFHLAEINNQLDHNYFFLLRNWNKRLGLKSRQIELEKQLNQIFKIDVSMY
ncbi:MAG: thioredoxin family protein [Candidatus Cloacimonetes bacterium]|nr:thioredoxin family protein [Candidatus Cloacimonadota bacterium]